MSTSLDYTRLSAFQKRVEELKESMGISESQTYHAALSAIADMQKRGFISDDLTTYEFDLLVSGLQAQFRRQPVKQVA